MINNRFCSLWVSLLCALCLLFIPELAMAQDSVDSADKMDTMNLQDESTEDEPVVKPKIYTTKDNFGGWNLGAEILFGATNYVTNENGGSIDLHYSDPDNSNNFIFNTTLQLQVSYLWGNNVFVGPVLNVITGWPMLFAADIRIRLLIPLGQYKKNAVSANAGWGVSITSFIGGDENLIVLPSSDYSKLNKHNDIDHLMYFPIEFTYEHVFDNRFILGASIQFIINYQFREYYSRSEKNNIIGNENYYDKYKIKFYDGELAVPTMNSFVAGIHMGYKF